MESQINNQIHIPNKRYFTIGEVSKICKIKTHVLRYWEQEFKELEPIKRKGNRRYYQQKDLILVLEIRNLLHNEGFTIEGAKTKINNSEKNIIPLILAGFLPAAQIGFYNIGQAHTLASHGIIMIVTFPLWAAIFSHFFTPNDKLTLSRILGLITAYSGVIVLFWDSINQNFTEYLWGDILMLLSAMILGGRLIWVSHITQRVEIGRASCRERV